MTVDGLPALFAAEPTATELEIVLPFDLALPDPAFASVVEICRYISGEGEPE